MDGTSIYREATTTDVEWPPIILYDMSIFVKCSWRNQMNELEILTEIRDLLRYREEKYDRYLKQASEQYQQQLKLSKVAGYLNLLWLCLATTAGVFLGGAMLKLLR